MTDRYWYSFFPVVAGGEAANQLLSSFNAAVGVFRVVGSNEDDVPGGYLNYVFMDKDLNFDASGPHPLGFKQITSAADFNTEEVTIPPLTIEKEGYIFVYVSNESNTANYVHFDELTVTVKESPIVQTADYYPFGMRMAGGFNRESSPTNRYLYNSKEYQEDLGLNWLDYGQRMRDPWGGPGFNSIDRFAEKYYSLSPYQYAANNPISNIDINGDSIWVTTDVSTEQFDNGVSSTTINHTINITGKVLNVSGSDINVDALATGIQNGLNSLSASDYNRSDLNEFEVNISIDADIQGVSSIDDVSSSDHLIAVVDNVEGKGDPALGGGEANGLAAVGGQVAFIEPNGAIRAGIHEIGHTMGLRHSFDRTNIMSYSNGFSLNFNQLNKTVVDSKNGRLNRGNNSTRAGANYTNLRSTNSQPYRFGIRKGQRVPLPINRR